MKTKVILILTLLLLIGGYFFYQEGKMPVNKHAQKSKIFVVKPGDSLNTIVNNLAKEGLIRNKLVFYFIVRQLGIEKKIQAGDFRLSPMMDAYTIAKNLTHGTLDRWLTIIEGWRKEEIANLIAKNFEIEEIEFIKQAREGYLFPDTYLIPKNANVKDIINILEKNYHLRYQQALVTQPKKNDLSDKEILILASLVEKEARLKQDKNEVAKIIYKRLKNNWRLDLDATVQYALGYSTQERSWWKKNLTQEDLAINSLYNTYKVTGLPPGPICNPGIDSLQAAAAADENTPYWYYISDKTGKMHYAKTLEEHEVNIARYLQ
jgi:UPF0755 protein